MEKLKGALAVFLGASSFGILSTFVKKAYGQGLTLGEVTGIQVLFGMLMLWLIFIVIKLFSGKSFQSSTKKIILGQNIDQWYINRARECLIL